MKKNDILGGLLLIVIAVLLIGHGMGILPDIPWFKIACTAVFVVFAARGIWRRHFFGAMLSLGCVAWIWDSYLQIEKITPFPLLLAAGLLGAGLNMIFGKNKKIITVKRNEGGTWRECTIDEASTENWQDGRHVKLENIFNSTSKYVNSEAFSSADFENIFGSSNIYFDNAIIANGVADVHVENVFGQLNLYFPATWRLQMDDKSAVFGNVSVHGRPSMEPDAPLIRMSAESVFGSVNIYFG